MPAWIASSVSGCLFMKSTTTSVVMVPMAARMAVAIQRAQVEKCCIGSTPRPDHVPKEIVCSASTRPSPTLRASIDGLNQGKFTEGHGLGRKWRVPKEMVGRRLSQEEAKRLLAKLK